MFSKKDILNIAYRNWKGESLKEIAPDFNTTEKELAQLRKDNRSEFAHLEVEFRNAEIQRLAAGDPIRKIQYGFVISAYMLARTREGMPQAIVEYSQKSDKPETHLHSHVEAQAVLDDFESDFGITLV